ncbi:MAG: SDR family oxidoreductase [Bacteroidia bacterium]
MKDKVVIITGASSGIGKATAEVFAKQGSKVVLNARNEKLLTEVTEKIKKDFNNSNLLAIPGDVSIESDCKKLIDDTIAYFGKIDILINNAGISMRALFTEVDLSVLKKVMDINFYGTVYCTKYALPHLIKSKGSLVGISSIAGYKGLPARTGYSSSKFAMQGFLEAIRIENLKNGLHVLVACPGFTNSNIRFTALTADGSMQGDSPLDEKNMMSAETVALHLYKAIRHRKRDLILTTQGKLTVLLNKFFPAWMDKMVYKTFAKEPNSPLK